MVSDMSSNWSDIKTYEDLSVNQGLFVDWLATPGTLRKEDEFFQGIDTQSKLAEKLNVTPRTLCRWKRKKVFMDIVEKRQREIIGLDGITKTIDALIQRSQVVNDPKKIKEANKAAEILCNWLYNRNFAKGTNLQQSQSQSQKGMTLKDIHEMAEECESDADGDEG